jgi:hypothetical protein
MMRETKDQAQNQRSKRLLRLIEATQAKED